MLKNLLRDLFGSGRESTPAPNIDDVLKDLGIGRVVNTIENATGFKAELSEQTERFHGDPRITFGYKDAGHTETTKTYAIPLKKARGKTDETEPIYSEVWVPHTHEFASSSDGHYSLQEIGHREAKERDLVDKITISVTNRSDDPDNRAIDISATKFVPNEGFFKELVKTAHMNIDLKAGNPQRELLTKIANFLEDLNK